MTRTAGRDALRRHANPAPSQRPRGAVRLQPVSTSRLHTAEVAPDGTHLLVCALPHGVRPKSRRTDWPAHYRTAWYAEMADASNAVILLDVEVDELERLPKISDTRDEIIGRAEGAVVLPALVTFADGHLIDGCTVFAALQKSGGTRRGISVAGAEPL
jgi:hypothetical protein